MLDKIPGITFHSLKGEGDYKDILSIYLDSTQADQIIDPASLEDIKRWCGPSNRFDPHTDLLVAEVQAEHVAPIPVGFSRLSWYTGLQGVRLYTQSSYLRAGWRVQDIWPHMVRNNEHRLQEIAASHPPTTNRFYQAWTTSTQVQWIAALEGEGYRAVRHFNNMLHRLEGIPEPEIPQGLEIRPVKPEHYRSIWEGQREVQLELFEVIAENWAEDRFEAWRDNPFHTPHRWQVAWDGDQVAGMVLGRIDKVENQALKRKRGYTEHIFVRRPWRKRGLARALILRNLQDLRAQGMQESELGVDTENESGAYEFYKRLGFQTFSTDIWYRKPMA